MDSTCLDIAIARLRTYMRENDAENGVLEGIIEDLESVSSSIDADNVADYWRRQMED